jgi:hypothetical protein
VGNLPPIGNPGKFVFFERILVQAGLNDKMQKMDSQTVHTRASLIQGIQSGDEDRWREFHRLYGPIIRAFALKAGLNETEADEVVQETCIGLAKNVGKFHYDPAKCRFKTWLLNLASWRVNNQFILQK